MASKNKYIAFHGGNEQAVQVYRDLKRIAHEKDLFIWQVIRDGLAALESVEMSKGLIEDLPRRQQERNQTNSPEPVIIKSIDGSLYCKGAVAHNQNFYLSSDKSEAMVFGSREQAAAFLRKCGHEVGNWIIEPA